MNFKRIPKSNLHTHTRFCDGANTAEEMVLSAIEKGMEALGFSGHSPVFFDPSCSMSPENERLYRQEILRLKELYKDRIHILLGIEQDFYSDSPAVGYNYIIGSVHYFHLNEKYPSIDQSKETTENLIKQYFGGDPYRFVRHYYGLVAQVADKTNCDIVGHFDLITKFNERGDMFDETDPRYLRSALDALDALLEKDVIFEINTGAISRGYRRTPYPAPIFLHRIAEKRGRVTFSSDSHHRDTLLQSYPEAIHIARSAGLGSIEVMTRNGWKTWPL